MVREEYLGVSLGYGIGDWLGDGDSIPAVAQLPTSAKGRNNGVSEKPLHRARAQP